MVRIDLTMEGDVSDVINTIRQLVTRNGSSPVVVSRDPGSDPPVEQPVQPPVDDAAGIAKDPWTEELVRALWALLTPDVQWIYRRVAHGSGHALAREALLDAMGLTPVHCPDGFAHRAALCGASAEATT